MSRGFKIDRQATAEAKFLDKRSFVSLPKFTHGTEEMPHLLLYGKDKSEMRTQVFLLNRRANGGSRMRCWNCAAFVSENGEDAPHGEWDHVLNKAGQRCDCAANGRVACADCHRGPHGTHPGRG